MLREREERRKEKNYHEMKQFHRQNLLVYYKKKKKKVYDQTFSENDYFQVKKMTCETAGTLNRNSHQ